MYEEMNEAFQHASYFACLYQRAEFNDALGAYMAGGEL